MSRNAMRYWLAGLLLVIVAAGFLAPIGSYTYQNSCLADETSHVLKQRLTLIKGDTLGKAKAGDISPNATGGCTLPTKYTLYIL